MNINGRPAKGFQDEFLSTTSITTNASNTTASVVLFTITGAIEVTGIWGVVTTALSSNHTAAHLRLNDQTATPAITLASGTTLSSDAAGSVIAKTGQVDVAITELDNAAGVVSESAVDNLAYLQPFTVVKKTAAVTTIDYRYTTTNTPATGVIQWFMRWKPLSADARVV